MRTGIGFPSYAAEATFAAFSGAAFDGNYPVTNLANLVETRRVGATGAATSLGVTAVLAQSRAIGLLALVQPKFTVDTTLRVRLFSGVGADPVANSGTIVYDTGVIDVWPTALSQPLSIYPPCRPVVLPGPITCRSANILLSSATSQAWELGGIELAGWFALTDIDWDRSIGLDSQSLMSTVSGGVDHVTEQWSPRTFAGNRNSVEKIESDTTLMDFRMTHGQQKPFVFVDDPDTPESWPRRCFLARNMDVPGDTVNGGLWASSTISFVEHL